MGNVPSPITHANRVYDSLRRDIVDGRFKAGEKLTINSLKNAYNVGLSPLREALNRLATYGLLVQENQRGFRVPDLSRRELDDIAVTRRKLECMALEQAISFGDQQWEADLSGAMARLQEAGGAQYSANEWEQYHLEFHRSLVSACGSVWQLRFIGQLHDQFDRYRRHAPENKAIRLILDSQHEELADLAIQRDLRRASLLMEQHIMLSYQVAIGAF